MTTKTPSEKHKRDNPKLFEWGSSLIYLDEREIVWSAPVDDERCHERMIHEDFQFIIQSTFCHFYSTRKIYDTFFTRNLFYDEKLAR